jgi:hypothetical protein
MAARTREVLDETREKEGGAFLCRDQLCPKSTDEYTPSKADANS